MWSNWKNTLSIWKFCIYSIRNTLHLHQNLYDMLYIIFLNIVIVYIFCPIEKKVNSEKDSNFNFTLKDMWVMHTFKNFWKIRWPVKELRILNGVLPNQELSGAKSALQEETVAYVHHMRVAANHPIIYLRPTFGLQNFFHRHITSNSTTFGLPSGYREIPHLRIISIHTNYGLPAEKSL